MTLDAGVRLGSYEIRGFLGAGGMGEVYRARDSKLSREVALKVLPSGPSGDPRRLQRFEKEARAASALNHPNIVTVYEIGAADGASFIAMELVEGKTLRQVLNPGSLPVKKLLSIGAQTADGLAKAHAAGIVHRDLKPENLMVTKDGFVKILDFGLAKLMGLGFEGSEGAGRSTLTRVTEAGTVLGTVGYMSPEQASGEPADFRSDQFSLGSILYEAASGKRAFERPTDAQTLSAIIESEPEPLERAVPRLPANLSWVVERCLAKDPDDRYASTKDLARDLALLRDRSTGASGAGIAPPVGRRFRLSRAGLAAAVLGAAGLAALTFLAGERVQARLDRSRPPPKLTSLTFRRGFLTGARFAPDGQTVVYSASWDGRPSEIFTTRVGSTESRSIFENAVLLAVSSKGELAISIDCGPSGVGCMGTLARMPLAGGSPREVQHAVTSADWSPDGGELAAAIFSRIEYPIGKVLYQNQLGFLSSVRVSPDGNLVAFIEHPRRDSDSGILSVVDRAGRKRVLSNEWTSGPILWSSSGKEVFYSRWGGREKRGADLAGRIRSVPWVPGLDDVSREGLFLDSGVQAENYRGVVMVRNPHESEERNVSWLGRSVAADLSRDGEHVLLYEEGSARDRPDQQVFTTFLRATDGSDVIAVGEGRALALSPDKEWALVARSSPDTHLLLLPIGAGEPRRLSGGGLLYRRASFFPDGKRIVFTGDDGQRGAASYVQDLQGGAPKQIGPTGFVAGAVSPDGLSVAGSQGESGIAVHRADGGGVARKLAGSVALDFPLQWSADGRMLYVRSGNPEPPLTIYGLDILSGRRELWKRLAPPDMTGFLRYGPRIRGVGYAVAADGRSYAYTYFTDQSRLVLTEGARDWWK